MASCMENAGLQILARCLIGLAARVKRNVSGAHPCLARVQLMVARALGLTEAAVRQRLLRARRLFQQLYLLESGEAILDEPSLTQQAEATHRRLTLMAQSPCARAAAAS